jgi:hypothetical protein
MHHYWDLEFVFCDLPFGLGFGICFLGFTLWDLGFGICYLEFVIWNLLVLLSFNLAGEVDEWLKSTVC